jgi:two-component system sensor histidine kinase/response regulator
LIGSHINILLVEDNTNYARLLEHTLVDNKSQSIHLETVDQLSLGRQRLAEGGIDVVLLDLSLPDSQGLDTLTGIQSTAPDVPIIVLTGLDDDRLGLEAIGKGAQDYFVKGEVEHHLLTRALHYAIERKQAGQALRASEARYRSLFEESGDAILIFNHEKKFIEANQVGLTLLGYTRDEMSCLDFGEIYIDPNDRAELQNAIQAHGFVQEYEIRLRRKDGTKLDCLLSSTAWQADDERNNGYQIIVRDITMRKRMEEKLHERHRTLHRVISSLPNALLVIDEDNRLTSFFFPPHFTPIMRMEKISPEISPIEVLPTEMAALMIEALILVRQTGEISAFEQMVIWGETSFFYKVKVSPVVDSGDVLIVIDDITELKRAEETIRRYATELELRNKELDAFSHTVAHDLKAPLSNILMFVSTVLIEEQDRLSPMSRECLQGAEKTVFVMSDMVDNLLLFARLRDASELIEEVEMMPVIQGALARLREAITERGIFVDVQPELPSVMGHAPWLEEVLANLIGNAAKYIGKDNPTPQISIRGHRQDGKIRYEVHDNGLGITLADQAKLFEMFSRFHHKEAKGVGLGLSIVQRIIDKLNGEVGVESTPGQGSTFWFTLPASP